MSNFITTKTMIVITHPCLKSVLVNRCLILHLHVLARSFRPCGIKYTHKYGSIHWQYINFNYFRITGPLYGFHLQRISNAERWCSSDISLVPTGSIDMHGSLTRYVKLRVAHAPGMPGTFSPPLWTRDPDMHHGTCVAAIWQEDHRLLVR